MSARSPIKTLRPHLWQGNGRGRELRGLEERVTSLEEQERSNDIALRLDLTFRQSGLWLLGNFEAGSIVRITRVSILSPFSDPATEIKVGTSAQPGLLLDVLGVGGASQFRNSNVYRWDTPVTLQVILDAKTSTSGDCIVLVDVR